MCSAVYMDVFELPMEVNIPIPASYIYRISSIYPMRIILLQVRILCYICSRARGSLPFFSHSHVTDRLLPAKATRLIRVPPPPEFYPASLGVSPQLQIRFPPIITRHRVDQRIRNGKKNNVSASYFSNVFLPSRQDRHRCVMHLYQSSGSCSYRVLSMTSQATIQFFVTTHTRGRTRIRV